MKKTEKTKKQYTAPKKIAAEINPANRTACGKYSACGELVRGR